MPFRFKEGSTPQENIAEFLAHLETVDKTLADILKANIPPLVPFPSDPQVRSTRRTQINTAVRNAVDAI